MNLSVRDLVFSYSAVPVLRGVSFDVSRGECVAVLGNNGAGKSTLLKCINRLLTARAGSIAIEGEDVGHLKGAQLARMVGYVPQNLAFSDSTVFDAVLMGRRPYIRWEATEKDLGIVGGLLDSMHLAHLALRRVNELSGGERQKVAIARALAQQPRVLLFDEPTSSLDIRNQIDVVNMIRTVAAENDLSAIVTMHDLNLALRFGDRFLMLKDGVICAAGGRDVVTPETIRAVYGLEAAVGEVAGHPVVVPV